VWRPADVPTNGVRAITTKGKADNFDPTKPFGVPIEFYDKLVEEANTLIDENWRQDMYVPGLMYQGGKHDRTAQKYVSVMVWMVMRGFVLGLGEASLREIKRRNET
jgi:hypothetical protein